MNKITIKEIIEIECLLLMIEDKYKFKISFSNALKLDEMLEEIGKYSNKYFMLMTEYPKELANTIPNMEQATINLYVKLYNEKILAEELDINVNDSLLFINEIAHLFEDVEMLEKLKSFSQNQVI